ncbi:MAG: TIGR03032 family protein [Planctomycetota bacterium]
MSQDQPLRSVHTSNLPEILDHFGVSVMVTTYQAGRLVILRSQGGVLNTHFRSFDKPMGLAITGGRLAIGAGTSIWEFHNLPAVCTRLSENPENENEASKSDSPVDPIHDACFLPRTTHWTGDIQIHEMAWVGKGNEADLWFVNTRFSCLCRRSDVYSFEPVWRPSFIQQYVPGDCCHLNGLGLREGRPRYVTALGETGDVAGWRENKANGGILMDLEQNEVICRELSMPHSPRWYRDRLWLLESGTGSFGYIDAQTGTYHAIASLPGFTRGLTFTGPLAWIGLSQVRESAVFGGIPIAERALEERACGVWVINIETQQTVGFVKFEDAVQEIFAVEIMPARYPELVNEDRELLGGSFELPDAALNDVPPELRAD